ncbi:unnamed protein product [Calicophoron daubneyi]|uniref:Enoyl-CoA hydratase domain-containing protein 3, mitochondrial n=1 Tax=Calicophoron daubneyi TaxID=300641 RepID=A0AAV2T2Z4_CALDB
MMKISRDYGLFWNQIRRISSMTPGLVTSERLEKGIEVLTMNNDKRGNCLSVPMLKELDAAITKANKSKDVRALVICGGPKFFSAGHDLRELHPDRSQTSREEVFTTCARVMLNLANADIPSVAAVRGIAFAAGCQLVAQCDLAVAGQSSTFSTPGVKLGFFCSTPGVPLVRAIGMRAAKELLMTGKVIDANRAYALNLVQKVVPDDQVIEAAVALANEITQHSRPVIAMGRQCLMQQTYMNLKEAYDLATKVLLENLKLGDASRGIDAFTHKKPTPKWLDK